MKPIRIFLFILVIAFTFNASAIVGAIEGEIPKEHPASYNTVAFVKKTDRPDVLKIFCSGVILSEKIIMTAKHCLAERKLEDIQVYFGNDTNNIDKTLLRKIKATSIYGPSDWQSYFPSFDFGWVELEANIPNKDGKDPSLPHFRAVPILADAQWLERATAVHLAGYGNRSTQLMEVIAGEKKHVAIGFKKYINTPQISSLILLEGKVGHSNCHGDSGGPAYARITDTKTGKDQWYVVGTASGFDLALTPKSYQKNEGDEVFPHLALCDKSQTLYTFIGDYIGWLQTSTGINIPKVGEERKLQPGLFERKDLNKNTFEHWCANSNFESPEWLTLRQMLIAAMENSATKYTQEEIFLNCHKAETALNTLNRLEFGDVEKFDSLKPIATIPGISRLDFSNTKIPDLTPLAKSSVTEITLREMKISSLGEVKGLLSMTQLQSLKLPDNHIQDINDLVAFPYLHTLNISKNDIHDISVLSQLKALEELDFFANQVSDMSPLYALHNLKLLIASLNQITSSPAPDGTWPYLEEIVMADNRLTDLEFLRNSYRLKRAMFSDNLIHSLEPLKDKNLERLVTIGNPL